MERSLATALVLALLAAGACTAPTRSIEHSSPQAPPVAVGGDARQAIGALARRSQCAAWPWAGRGVAPASYIEGMALVYARAACSPGRPDVAIVGAAPIPGAEAKDGLAFYGPQFSRAGLRSDATRADTLRHAYVMLIGLGMMESSGKPCEGRDTSQCFTTASSAEAGLFQTSYGARRASPILEQMFLAYSADQGKCALDIFQASLTCKIRKSKNPRCPDATSEVAGEGPGADWQRLAKACPAFATEYAAVVLRKNGGVAGEFGPVRKTEVEIRPECDTMLRQVQQLVEDRPGACAAL